PEPLSRFLTRELDALRRTAPADAVAALSRLVAGIERLHPAWTAAGEPADHVRALRDLAAALSAALPTAPSAAPPTTTDPARRLREAITALEGLTAPRRGSFWKR
ncbi:trypsin, partial [Saccharothrix algeriensis]